MTELLLGALLVLTVAWLVVRIRHNKTATEAESRPKPKTQGEYHAVAIKYSENACNAAKAMTGRRFLASAAPQLPLAKCDAHKCRCKYVHYEDRRKKNDRRSPFAHLSKTDGTGSFERERRKKTDRRKSSET
jgi:hypothetical protein